MRDFELQNTKIFFPRPQNFPPRSHTIMRRGHPILKLFPPVYGRVSTFCHSSPTSMQILDPSPADVEASTRDRFAVADLYFNSHDYTLFSAAHIFRGGS